MPPTCWRRRAVPGRVGGCERHAHRGRFVDPGELQGNAAVAGLATFLWSAPVSGQFRITVTGATPHVVDVRGGNCNALELACRPASTSAMEVERQVLPANDQLTIEVSGDGAFELTIAQLPDVCGDNLCEASESSASCPSDCPVVVCGDGRCRRPSRDRDVAVRGRLRRGDHVRQRHLRDRRGHDVRDRPARPRAAAAATVCVTPVRTSRAPATVRPMRAATASSPQHQ